MSKVVYLQTERNKKKAEQSPSAVNLRAPKSEAEQRMDAQLEKLIEVIDGQQERIERLEERVGFLNRVILRMVSDAEELPED
jgi:cupin superfamily acireductone dioxygenase involved in methionine salvage